MNRTRYLPPGSMRRQRRLGRLEGSVGPQPAPLPQVQHHAGHVPEPGTLALIGAGLASLIWRTKA